MKHIPRAEISTIQDVLYPLRRKGDPTWSKKNLEDLKELKQKVDKLKEEKQKELDNKPEPFKLKRFRNIPSKFMDTKDWIIKKQKKYLENNQSSINIYIQNSHDSKYNRNQVNNIRGELNKTASIKNLPIIKSKNNHLNEKKYEQTKGSQIINRNILNINNIINETKTNNSMNDLELAKHNINTNNIFNNNIKENNKNNTINNNDNEFNLEKELEKIPLEEGPSIFEKPINNDEEIEKLIKEYKEKYGDTEMIESLIKEFEDMKQKRKTRIELEQKILEEQKIQNNDANINNNNTNINQTKEKEKLKDSIQKYEPILEKENNSSKPPIPTKDDFPFLLPKINKNYVKENIKLITDNKVPQKKYVNYFNNINNTSEEKHKNFGKVPKYIKKFEQEREHERQEKIRKQMELKYPKGTRLLSEEERIQTLNSLKKAQIENSLILEKMPITNRTFKLQQKREELMRKLSEIDKAIEMFSKKQVFVKKK